MSECRSLTTPFSCLFMPWNQLRNELEARRSKGKDRVAAAEYAARMPPPAPTSVFRIVGGKLVTAPLESSADPTTSRSSSSSSDEQGDTSRPQEVDDDDDDGEEE